MDKQKEQASPLSARTYQEEQDRWLEWRSRQLEYLPLRREEKKTEEPESIPPPTPVFQNSAPSRHRELDRVWEKHAMASRRAGRFTSVTQNESAR